MSDHPADFRIEIIKGRPQGIAGIKFGFIADLESEATEPMDPPGEVIDITDHVELDGIGTVNRALERDLLSFKTGDMTLTANNPDGFFDDLFTPAVFGPTTIWGLRVFRRGVVQFYGCLIGQGSIIFDLKELTVEITAYGLTKLLDRTSAELVRRPFPNVTFTSLSGTTLTISSTLSLLTGDVIHLTDHVNSDDVTVKQVTSSTVVQLEAAAGHAYAAGTEVTVKTKFNRYKSIPFLVEKLFRAAFVRMADLRLSGSQFRTLAPTPVNQEGLIVTNDARRGTAQLFGKWQVSIATVDGYSQEDPDDAWTVQGQVDKGIYDWQPYFTQGFWPGGPNVGTDEPFALFEPVVGATQETSGAGTTRFATYWGAADYLSATKRIWGIGLPGAATTFAERTTVDGITYTAATTVAIPGSGSVTIGTWGSDYDPQRNIVHQAWRETGGTGRFYYRDLGGASWVDCKQADDDANTGYFGPRYVRDLDLTLVLRVASGNVGPTFEICAFRGATRLWKRPFPSCLVQVEVSGNPFFYPTRTARFINGILYIALVSDGAVQFVTSKDEFQTYQMSTLVGATSKTTIMTCRVGDTYRIACYKGANPRGYFICAPFYAGVIEYADFEGLSVGEALKKLAVLANALFRVDDDLQGHFVARDLYDPGAVTDIDDLVLEETEDLIWDQVSQYVRVSGGGFEATAGNPAFAAEGKDIESSFIPNEAFAQALADAFYEFYSQSRIYGDSTLIDLDGRIYWPLDRVRRNGLVRFAYEDDHDLVSDEHQLAHVENR